jgi:phospholipid/cholesterol/gamma-HCH transport system substrate-binding protein
MSRTGAASSLLVIGAFALLCVSGLGFLAVSMGLEVPGLRQGWQLDVSFAAAEGLVPQSDVDVSGVRVGRVVRVAADGQGGVLASMLIDRDVRLRQDVTASVRPKSLVGETFVELTRIPGSTAPYALDGYRLPRRQTGNAVQIDDVLNGMDPETRAAFSSSLRELGVALDGRQGDVSASIPPLEQAAADLRPLARTADARQREIDRILSDLAVIMAALADEQDALGRVVDSGDTATSALARRDRDLAGTVEQADRLFASLEVAFAGTTPANRAALQEAPGTIGTGRQLLSRLNPAVDRLLPELLLAQVNYPSNQLSVSHPEAITLAEAWISAFAQNDSLGHSFRVTAVTDPALALRQPALAGQPSAAVAPAPAGQPAAGPGTVPPAARMLLGSPPSPSGLLGTPPLP